MPGKKILSPAEEMDVIRKAVKFRPLAYPDKLWLNTGNKMLNNVLGSEEKGLAYGKMIELFGPESGGKTLIAILLTAIAQHDGAKAAWVDLESSLDEPWLVKQGVKWEELYPFFVEIGTFGNEEKPRLESAEEILQRTEIWMERRHKEDPKGKMVVVVDSVAAMLTEDEADAGLTGQSMYTNASLSKFLSKFLRRWAPLAANYNALIILVNQVRESIGSFGAPEKPPGGRATKHYCSIRANVRRMSGKNGRIIQGHRIVGIRSVIRNIKNKSGEGSLEGGEAGFEVRFDKKSWKFRSVSDIRKETEQ